MIDRSYITLCTSDSYVIGVCVLAASLRKVNTVHPLYCLIPDDGLTMASLILLLHSVDGLILIDTLETHTENMDLLISVMKRPELRAALTKINVWKFDGSVPSQFICSPFSPFSQEHSCLLNEVQPIEFRTFISHDQVLKTPIYIPCLAFKRCVYLDADLLILKNLDRLLEDSLYERAFAAAPDIGWPDIFNSGLFVFTPNHGTFLELEKLVGDPSASFDGKLMIFFSKF